jgi:hypothetical protein
MGLARVLICTVPVAAIISLVGLQLITDRFNNRVIKGIFIGAYLTVITVYPFIDRPWAIVFDENLFLVAENRFIEDELVPYVKSNFPNYLSNKVYYSHPYICVALDLDYFDTDNYLRVRRALTDTDSTAALVFWDEWFSRVDENITKDQLQNIEGLEQIKSFERQYNERLMELVVYKK